MLMASTGQASAASLAQASVSAGTGSAMTTATLSILKTAGQLSAHNPQPVQTSGSILALTKRLLWKKTGCHHG